MTRTVGLLLACGVGWAAAHPLCFFNDRPTNYDHKMSFCPPAQDGACCTDMEEEKVKSLYHAAGNLSADCGHMYKQVVCGVCHSYSAHLYEILGARFGDRDGMTMKRDFCEELVHKCKGEINFASYDGGMDYCDMHVGGSKDRLWSYPYTEPEIFEPGLMKVFPDLDVKHDFPKDTISLHQTPDGTWWWLMGQRGEIKKVHVDNLGSIDTVVNIADDVEEDGARGTRWKKSEFYEAYEEGLLDFAFSPLFGENNFFYLSYTCILDDGALQRNRLAKFVYHPHDPTRTRNSEVVLLTTVPKFNSIHAAGWCGFKPLDYGREDDFHDLYWTTGDGGPQTDPDNQSQNAGNMLGSMMRISVPSSDSYKHTDKYRIPYDNFKSDDNKPEICASGLRNPFRCGFDSETDDLYCGDVGHTNVEEINLIECGNNYGWSRFEGTRCQEAVQGNKLNPMCEHIDRSEFEFPYFEYCHPDYHSDKASEREFTGNNDFCGDRLITGHAVIGGYVYRGQTFSDLLEGAYIFGDAKQRNIYFIKKETEHSWSKGTIVSDASVAVISFAETVDRELVLITKNHHIYKLPCGDLCATTCLDQAQYPPTIESIGCFTDKKKNNPVLTLARSSCDEDKRKMSPAICAAFCSTVDGAVYAGVKNSSECYCGSEHDLYNKNSNLPSEDCEMLCTATPHKTCGGQKSTEIFKLGHETIKYSTPAPVPRIPEESGYVGCFADDRNARIMDTKEDTSRKYMTNQKCKSLCKHYGYYGTQLGKQCWCSDTVPVTYDPYFEPRCDNPCPGDRAETCGGELAMSVFKNENTTPPPPPGSPTPSPGNGYKHLGCYVDDFRNRVLKGRQKFKDSEMTTDKCFNFCEGFPYFGTEYGSECYCGDYGDDPEKRPQAYCNTPCAGDSSEICGGAYIITVYKTFQHEEPTPSPAPGYLGCFADDKKSRIMTKRGSKKNMTRELCETRCEGSTFYGLQNGKTCWCGKSYDFDRHGKASHAKCNKKCSGNSKEYCGGRLFTSVYAYYY